MTSHLDDNTLRLFAAGRLDADRDAQIESHLTDCTECLERLHRIETEQPSRLIQQIQSARIDDSAESETIGIKAVRETSDFIPGDRIGDNYRLEEQVGRGGMGVAWKAYDETAERYVALKFVPKEIQHIAEAMASVRESFQKVHALQHQNVCPLYGLFSDPKHGLFLVMKFVDGLTLGEFRKQQIKQHGSISFEKIVEILTSIADGLDYAHRQKVVHRDIKPPNVIISPKDGVQIIDFGLADEIHESLSRTENFGIKRITGTRSYMAPEQWEGRKQDAKTDQYALAVTAYELLAGHVPFSGTDTEILKKAVLHDPPTSIPDLPEHVNAALLKGLAKNPSDRFSSCKAFVEALAEPSDLPKTPSRKWLTPTIRIGTILVLAIVAYFTAHSYLKPITDIDSPGIQHNSDAVASDMAVHVGNRRIILPAKQVNYPNDKNSWQMEPNEKRAKRPSLLDEQWKYQNPPTDISSQRMPVRTQVFNVLRVVMAINADGSGQLTAKRGKSSEPLFPFQGTQFDSHVFDAVLTFRGEIPGVGRVLFPTGYPLIRESTEPFSLSTNQSHGWKYDSLGDSYDPVRAQTRFSNSAIGSRAGFYLDKAGALPLVITYDVVDDNEYPPDFELSLYRDHQGEFKIATIFCRWERDHMNRLRMSEAYWESSSEEKRNLITDNVALNRGMALDRPFRLPPDVTKNVKMFRCGLWVNPSEQRRKQPGFDLTLLDIVGHFKGDVGFRIENKGDAVIVGKKDWSNPVPMLPNAEKPTDKTSLQPGDTVLGINGQSGSAETLQKILDSLNFGDVVTVRYASKADDKVITSRFHAE